MASSTINNFNESLAQTHYSLAFIDSLITCIENSNPKTFQQLNNLVDSETKALLEYVRNNPKVLHPRHPLSIDSIAEYFTLMLKKTHKKYGSDPSSFKVGLLQISKEFKEVIKSSTSQIVSHSKQIFRAGIRVMLYSYSRSVVASVKEAAKKYNGDIEVVVCETSPLREGVKTYKELREVLDEDRIRLIFDNQINLYMDKVDAVLVGAELVLENGAVLSRIGTSLLAFVAKAKKRNFYVFAESYKFCRKFILRQSDIPQPTISVKNGSGEVEVQSQTLDFTQAQYIDLVCTDMGLFTTSAISDGLIKLFKK